MKPVISTIEIPVDRDHVYEFLAVLANHESFTDHLMQDWRLSGPPRGIGAKVDVTAVMGGRKEPVEITAIEDVRPSRLVEQNVSAAGKRRATGTYILGPTAGGTKVTFTYAWQEAPLLDRLLSPLVRSMMQRGLDKALSRLREQLTAAGPAATAGAA
jgi:hypothetical protein